MSPTHLALISLFVIASENIMIERFYPTVSPLITLAIYGLSMIAFSLVVYPFRNSLGLGFEAIPAKPIPFIVAGAWMFSLGACCYFGAYARGATKEFIVTFIALVPVTVTLLGALLDRKWPSLNMLGASIAAAVAIVLVRRELHQMAADAAAAANAAGVTGSH